jgi:prepilin-type N-terminal cleavage/methylation domain-containing protein
MKQGFTFIELVMVILIIGILSVVIATDLFSSLRALRLEGAKWKLKSDILFAQGLAVTQQINHGVMFDPVNETYSVYMSSQNTTNIETDPLTQQPLTVDFTKEPNFKGVVIYSTSFGSPTTTNRLEFNQFGTPYSDAGVTPLSANGTVTLRYGSGPSATVTVIKNTGNVQ